MDAPVNSPVNSPQGLFMRHLSGLSAPEKSDVP